ncbi:MAG: BspA family leucine-rich repeat surface protein [Bacteroidales bacterium]|nr:BspA family leucine-rich repeat surface protein [Bacteroidales bacterium]
MAKTTAYTYYDQSTKTFYFNYDDLKFTYPPESVGNLNSQYYEYNSWEIRAYWRPVWPMGSTKATKVELTDKFLTYINDDPTRLQSCFGWFELFSNLEEIVGLDKLNTSEVKEMSHMFSYCRSLSAEALSGLNNFDTRQVMYMYEMFSNCFLNFEDGIDLDLSGFECPKVEDVCGMFRESNIRTVNLIRFGGASVLDFRRMFYNCTLLEEVDLDSWQLADGVYASTDRMFCKCTNLKKVKLGGIRVGGPPVLNHLNLQGEYMFEGCSSLESIDMHKFEILPSVTGKFVTTQFMFKDCISLRFADLRMKFPSALPSAQTDSYVSCQSWFCNCPNLEVVDIRGWGADYVSYWLFFSGSDRINQQPKKLHTIFVSDGWSFSDGLDRGQPNWMFFNCLSLIGGNGYQYPLNPDEQPTPEGELIISLKSAHVDEEGNPGFFTYAPLDGPLKYKIFYNLDEGSLPSGKTNPSEFASEDDDFTLVNPVRDGYIFTGWTGTTATQLSEPTKNVTVKKGSLGNRWYYANWKPGEIIDVEIADKASYPLSAVAYCEGNEPAVSLPYTVKQGVPTSFRFTFDNGTEPITGALDDSHIVTITIPDGMASGVYKGTLTFCGDPDIYLEASYPLTISANIPPKAAVQLYTDMLIADNHDGRFTAYQWFKDGSPIADATHGYYYDEKLGGKYTVELTTTDGGKFMSCPVKLVSTKALAQSVKAYPNPARRGETFAVEIADYDPAQEYSIMIFSANGLLVKKLTNVEQTTEMSLPTGVYSGSLISGGSKYGFKLIVE